MVGNVSNELRRGALSYMEEYASLEAQGGFVPPGTRWVRALCGCGFVS